MKKKIIIKELFDRFMHSNYCSIYKRKAVPCDMIDKYPELINYQQAKLLRIFSRWGNISMVQYLVEKGANIHALNNAPFTNALHNGHTDIVLYLLSLNVKVFSKKPIIITPKISETLPCCDILKHYPKMNLEEISNTILQNILQSKNVKQRGKYVDQLNQLIYHFAYLNVKLSKNIDAML